jgi:hypothetical protein
MTTTITEERTNEQKTTEKNVEGLNLDRFDCNHPDYHLRNPVDSEKLRIQHEASLTDPRRI